MSNIYLKTNMAFEDAIALSFPQKRWEYELQLREWVYVTLKAHLDKHVKDAIAARYRFGVELLMDEIDGATEPTK